MNIRDWPMERIMQLPDCCFGRRYIISASALSENNGSVWDISEIAFPERCVIWELGAWTGQADLKLDYFRLALGDQLPVSTAMMDALEPLIQGFGQHGPEPRRIDLYVQLGRLFSNLRMPLAAGGKRLVLETTAAATQDCRITAAVVVSSLPTEVPDWLSSAHL